MTDDVQQRIVNAARINRSLSERIIVLHDNGRNAYKVQGASGNIYDVNLVPAPICSCPDFAIRGAACKHLLYIIFRVLRILPPSSPTTLGDLLRQPVAAAAVATGPSLAAAAVANGPGLVAAAAAALSTETTTASLVDRAAAHCDAPVLLRVWKPHAGHWAAPRFDAGDFCALCFDTMTPDREYIYWCRARCGKCVHRACAANLASMPGGAICPFCRAPWSEPQRN